MEIVRLVPDILVQVDIHDLRGREEGLSVIQVVVVVIHQVCDQLVAKAIQGRHDVKGQLPLMVTQTSYKTCTKTR